MGWRSEKLSSSPPWLWPSTFGTVKRIHRLWEESSAAATPLRLLTLFLSQGDNKKNIVRSFKITRKDRWEFCPVFHSNRVIFGYFNYLLLAMFENKKVEKRGKIGKVRVAEIVMQKGFGRMNFYLLTLFLTMAALSSCWSMFEGIYVMMTKDHDPTYVHPH